MDFALQRFHNQRLIGTPFDTPEDVVRWLGAVQSQDYGAAKWGVAQRAKNAANADLDRIFNEGSILRTHVLRPTWHFVIPEDIRWLLKLTAPRVHQLSAYYYRQTGLDDAVFSRAHNLIGKALSGKNYLTREELGKALNEGGIEASGVKLGYIMVHAELEALICSGPLKGKQHSYALMEERAPKAKELDREECLVELAKRFVASRGPVTANDFANWSGLTVADAKLGLELNKGSLLQQGVYWFAEPEPIPKFKRPALRLLPNYDEYLMAYKDPTHSFDPPILEKLTRHDRSVQAHIIVRDGKIVGGWRRTLSQKEASIEVDLLTPLTDAEQAALKDSVARYGKFMGVEAALSR